MKPSRSLFFIAHGLGGAIVLETIRRSHSCKSYQSHLHSIYESTSGVMFFDVPHGGVDPQRQLWSTLERAIKVQDFKIKEEIIRTLLPSPKQFKELRDIFYLLGRENDWRIFSFQEQQEDHSTNDEQVGDPRGS
jgi:hypothetical protein